MKSKDFRDRMREFTEKIISSKEKLEPHQWISKNAIRDDFDELLEDFITLDDE